MDVFHVMELFGTNHSPFPAGSTLRLPVPSGLLLAAAEAKLDVRGEGILGDSRTESRTESRSRRPRGGFCKCGRASGVMYLKRQAVKSAFFVLRRKTWEKSVNASRTVEELERQ